MAGASARMGDNGQMRFIGDRRPDHDLTYSDVFMVPSRSAVGSRLDVDLTTTDGSGTTIPIVVANMTAVSGRRMAETVARRGGIAIMPQDIPIDVVGEVVAWVKSRHLVLRHRRSRSARPTPSARRSACCPSGRTARSSWSSDGRPVGVVTEADCQGVDRFTQLGQVMSRRPADACPAGTDLPEEAFDAAVRRRVTGSRPWWTGEPAGRA